MPGMDPPGKKWRWRAHWWHIALSSSHRCRVHTAHGSSVWWWPTRLGGSGFQPKTWTTGVRVLRECGNLRLGTLDWDTIGSTRRLCQRGSGLPLPRVLFSHFYARIDRPLECLAGCSGVWPAHGFSLGNRTASKCGCDDATWQCYVVWSLHSAEERSGNGSQRPAIHDGQ